MVIFSVTLLSSEIFIYHQKAFELFFKAMDYKIPHTIIIPDSKQICKALSLMKEEKIYNF